MENAKVISFQANNFSELHYLIKENIDRHGVEKLASMNILDRKLGSPYTVIAVFRP
jgi:hypothetical protein